MATTSAEQMCPRWSGPWWRSSWPTPNMSVGQHRPGDRPGDLRDRVGGRRRAGGGRARSRRPRNQSASETTGLKCAPDTGPNSRISTVSPRTVAVLFSSSCRPTSFGDSCWAAIPDPTTTATSRAVPRNSASSRATARSAAGGLGHGAILTRPTTVSVKLESMNIERTARVWTRRASVYAALADVTRLQIVDLLAVSDLTASEVGATLNVPSNLLAHHLNVLADAGLISRHRSEGDRRRHYLTLTRAYLTADTVGAQPGAANHHPGRVLFVCTANTARSHLAAALWRRASPITAASAGTHPGDRDQPQGPRGRRTTRHHAAQDQAATHWTCSAAAVTSSSPSATAPTKSSATKAGLTGRSPTRSPRAPTAPSTPPSSSSLPASTRWLPSSTAPPDGRHPGSAGSQQIRPTVEIGPVATFAVSGPGRVNGHHRHPNRDGPGPRRLP